MNFDEMYNYLEPNEQKIDALYVSGKINGYEPTL